MSEVGRAGEPLYDECRNCEGSGTEPFRTERNGSSSRTWGGGTCTQCDGLGIIPTAEGGRILDFIKRLRRSGRY